MKIQKTLFLVVLAMIAYSSVNAQLLVNGEYRSRFQALHGWKKPVLENTDAVFGFDQRSRINLDYKNEKFNVRFTLQDARVWGSEDIWNATGIVGKSNSLDIYEAWVDVKLFGNSSLKVGRQEWNYDDMRILCYRNWWTTGMSYDGLLYKMHNNDAGLMIDVGFSYNTEGANNADITSNIYPDKLQTVNFVNIKKQLNANSYVSLMSTAIGKQDTTMGFNSLLVKGTHGINFSLNEGKKATDGLTMHLTGYYQHGTDKSRANNGLGNRKKVSAYLVAGQVGYTLMDKKVSILAGAELLSGHDAKNTDQAYNDVQHNFDLFYSARFPYYGGNMTYFIFPESSKVGTKGGGLLDPYVKVNFKPAKKGMVAFAAWMPMIFTNVQKETDATTGDPIYYDEKGLGTYFDISYTHKFSPSIIFKVGGSYGLVSDTKNHMVYGYKDAATSTLNTLGQNYFAWTMLVIKPTFFKEKVEEKKEL